MRRFVIISFGIVAVAAACVGDTVDTIANTSDGGTPTDGSTLSDGTSITDAGTQTNDAGDSAPLTTDGGPIAAPRPIAPLSTSTVSKHSPTFHWAALPAGVDGVRVEICADRLCATLEQSFDGVGTSGKPTTPLAKGIHYWRLRSKSGALVSTLTGPTWEFRVRATDATTADTSWGSFSDFNGDGFSDVASLTPGPSIGYYLGGATLGGMQTIAQTQQAANDEEAPASVASADVNGDGFADLVVGGYCVPAGGPGFNCVPTAALADGGVTSSGHVYVYFGSATGLSTVKAPDVTIDSPDGTTTENFALNPVAVGDVNGDGYADVLSPALNYNGNAGRVYVFNGGPQGPAAAPSAALSILDTSEFGTYVAPLGDINGDGFADVAVRDAAANVYIFLGSTSGLLPPSNPTLYTPAQALNTDWAHFSYVPGDVNGDGFCDVLVGSQYGPAVDGGAGPGLVTLYLGHATIAPSTWMPSAILIGPDGNGSRFGDQMSVGDINGDGYDDALISAYGYNSNSGRAYVLNGAPTTTGIAASGTVLNGTGYFGLFVSAGMDVNGDGYTDAFIGTDTTGYMNMYLGGPNGVHDDAGTPLLANTVRWLTP